MYQIAVEQFEIVVLGENANIDQLVILGHTETTKSRHLPLDG